MKKTIILLLIFLTSNLYSNVHVGIGQKYSRIELAYADKAINPGDTVFIHAGNYSGYNGIVGLKGNPNGWIVFTKYQNDSVSIAGNWQFQACEYIKIINLNFKATAQSPGRLINVDNNGSCNTQSRFIKFDSCTFADVTDPNSITAFKFGGVDNFEVTNCVFTNMQVSGAFDFNVCHNGIIRGNRIENCLTGGHIKGGASDIVMERNTFINASKNGWVAFELGGDTGAQFYCPDDKFEVKNLKFYSNLVIGGDRGISLASATECKIIHNTFYNCGQATLRFLTTSTLYPTLNANRIENNIFTFGASAYMNGSTQSVNAASFSKNMYYSIGSNPFNGPYWDTPDLDAMKDKNQILYGSSAKIFVDGKNNDFHLIENSPAIGTGASETEPLLDYYGKPFNKNTRSIGAIEFLSASELNVSTNSINIPYQANSTSTFSIISNVDWSLSNKKPWITLDKKIGNGDAIIKITASENTSVSQRSATITISGSGLNNQYIIVNQDAGKAILNVSTNSINLPYQANSSATFSIKSNITWSASSNQTWLTLDKKNGSADDIIKLTASENTSVSQRSATITISDNGLNNQFVIVNQDAGFGWIKVDDKYRNINKVEISKLFFTSEKDKFYTLSPDLLIRKWDYNTGLIESSDSLTKLKKENFKILYIDNNYVLIGYVIGIAIYDDVDYKVELYDYKKMILLDTILFDHVKYDKYFKGDQAKGIIDINVTLDIKNKILFCNLSLYSQAAKWSYNDYISEMRNLKTGKIIVNFERTFLNYVLIDTLNNNYIIDINKTQKIDTAGNVLLEYENPYGIKYGIIYPSISNDNKLLSGHASVSDLTAYFTWDYNTGKVIDSIDYFYFVYVSFASTYSWDNNYIYFKYLDNRKSPWVSIVKVWDIKNKKMLRNYDFVNVQLAYPIKLPNHNSIIATSSDNDHKNYLWRIDFDETLGVEDIKLNSESNLIFPNPADNYIELNSDLGFSKIEIYNPLGMKILETEYQSKLDVSKLTTGIYFLKINDKLIKFVKR